MTVRWADVGAEATQTRSAPARTCPYGCGATLSQSGYCTGCGGRILFCKVCGGAGRALARFCRRCGQPLARVGDWPGWAGGAHGACEAPGLALKMLSSGVAAQEGWVLPYTAGAEAGPRTGLVTALGLVLFVDLNGRLHALAQGDGKGRVVAQGLLPETTPAVNGRHVYALAPDSVRLYEARPPPGPTPDVVIVEKAHAPLPRELGTFTGAPALAPQALLAVAMRGEDEARLVALDPHGLSIRWVLGPYAGAGLPPSMRGDLVAWGTSGGTMLLASLEPGQVVAATTVAGGLTWPPPLPVLADREGAARAMALDASGRLVVLDGSGAVGRPGLQCGEVSALALSPQGIHVGTRGDGAIVLYDARGRARVGGPLSASPPGRPDTVLPQMMCAPAEWVFGTEAGFVCGAAAGGAALAWSTGVVFPSGARLASFVIAGRRLVALSDQGEVRALDLRPAGRAAAASQTESMVRSRTSTRG